MLQRAVAKPKKYAAVQRTLVVRDVRIVQQDNASMVEAVHSVLTITSAFVRRVLQGESKLH